MLKNRKIFFAFAVFAVIAVFSVTTFDISFQGIMASSPEYPCTVHGLSGWAWSENIGWISMSCENCSGNNVAGCPPVNTDYGVDFDGNRFFGYAWSESLGWIHFDNVSVSGDSVTGSANVVSSGEEISFSGNRHNVNISNGELTGWGWGKQVTGWVSFSCENTGSCGDSDYRVSLTRPEARNTQETLDYCARTKDSHVRSAIYDGNTELSVSFQWEYYHAIGVRQEEFEIQLSETGDFNNIIFERKIAREADSGDVLTYLPHLLNEGAELFWGKEYHWRIKVYDELGLESDWSSPESFTLRNYPYPYAYFEDPKPSVEEKALFSAEGSEIYGGSPPSYGWTFEDGRPATSSSFEQEVVFDTTGEKRVTLTVSEGTGTGSDGTGSCTRIKNIRVRYPIPDWREVTPF